MTQINPRGIREKADSTGQAQIKKNVNIASRNLFYKIRHNSIFFAERPNGALFKPLVIFI